MKEKIKELGSILIDEEKEFIEKYLKPNKESL